MNEVSSLSKESDLGQNSGSVVSKVTTRLIISLVVVWFFAMPMLIINGYDPSWRYSFMVLSGYVLMIIVMNRFINIPFSINFFTILFWPLGGTIFGIYIIGYQGIQHMIYSFGFQENHPSTILYGFAYLWLVIALFSLVVKESKSSSS